MRSDVKVPDTMSSVTVHSRLCDYVHTIQVVKDGRVLVASVTSDCPHVQGLDGLKIPVRDLGQIRDNAILDRAQASGCSATCLVPCAIMNACWLEAGMMAESLCRSVGGASFEFDL